RPGDRITQFNGHEIGDYREPQEEIREAGGTTVPMTVERDGREPRMDGPIARNQTYPRADRDKMREVGILGRPPTGAVTRQGPGAVAGTMVDLPVRTAGALVRMREKMVGIRPAACGGEERDPNGPIGVVGVSRIGGDVA